MDNMFIIEKIKQENMEKAYIMATFYNKVIIGIYENETINFEENVNYELCTSLRIFNQEKEIRIDKIDNEYFAKVIQDNNYQYSLEDEYMFLSKKINIPNMKDVTRVIVRNYIKTDSNNQVIIEASRLVGFANAEAEVNI